MAFQCIGQSFLNREPIPGVWFQHNDYVRVVSGEHSGKTGALVTVGVNLRGGSRTFLLFSTHSGYMAMPFRDAAQHANSGAWSAPKNAAVGTSRCRCHRKVPTLRLSFVSYRARLATLALLD